MFSNINKYEHICTCVIQKGSKQEDENQNYHQRISFYFITVTVVDYLLNCHVGFNGGSSIFGIVTDRDFIRSGIQDCLGLSKR